MLKLIRTSIVSAAAAWGWRNRSTVVKKVRAITGKSDQDDLSTGYADVVDSDGILKPSEFDQATISPSP